MNHVQREVLRAFRHGGIRFLVVGGQAMRAYGIDRPTHDFDLWVARDLANAQALARFMNRVQNLPPLERLQEPNFKFAIGDPARPDVDILTSVAGDPQFEACSERSTKSMISGLRLPVIAPPDLLSIKIASAEKMELDQLDPNFQPADRAAAQRTAEKERRDIMFIRMHISTLPAA